MQIQDEERALTESAINALLESRLATKDSALRLREAETRLNESRLQPENVNGNVIQRLLKTLTRLNFTN